MHLFYPISILIIILTKKHFLQTNLGAILMIDAVNFLPEHKISPKLQLARIITIFR